jgi:hypothetical protein
MMKKFTPGLELSRDFFEQAVKPILDRVAPGLQYAAALIGSGSEVLGFDDEMSSDHHWGPRVMLFLSEIDRASKGEAIDSALRKQLPPTFLGYSTNFSEPDPNDNNVQQLIEGEPGSINHRVEIFTLRDYLLSYLGFDIDSEIEPADWLTFPSRSCGRSRTVTSFMTTSVCGVRSTGLIIIREMSGYIFWLQVGIASGRKNT